MSNPEDLTPTKTQPFERLAKITQSDTVDLIGVRGLLVGADAQLTMLDLQANTVSAFPMLARLWYPMRVTRVFTTGTDSVGIFAGY